MENVTIFNIIQINNALPVFDIVWYSSIIIQNSNISWNFLCNKLIYFLIHNFIDILFSIGNSLISSFENTTFIENSVISRILLFESTGKIRNKKF